MRLLFNNLPIYYAAPDADTGGNPDLTVDEALDFLNKEDDAEIIELDKDKDKDKDDDKDLDKDKDENKDEDKDLKALEEELDDENPDDEDLELVTPVRRSEILKKYPEFAKIEKDFPYLKKAYYREQQFTEIFPNPADAQAAAESAKTLEKFENDLFEGNTELILKSVKDHSPESFAKLVDNYLPALAKADNNAYLHIIGNITKHTILNMLEEAKNLDEESGNQLKIAASIVNKFVFGTGKFSMPEKMSKDEAKPDAEKNKLDSERKAFQEERFNAAKEQLDTRVTNSIKATLTQYIDPKKSMTDFVREHATEDALKEVSKALENDSRFQILVDKLWTRAAEHNYEKKYVDDIRNAFMSRARTVLPTVIKTARNKALKGMGKRVDKDDDKDTNKSGPVTRRSATSNNDDDKSGNKGPRKGESNLDFMMRD